MKFRSFLFIFLLPLGACSVLQPVKDASVHHMLEPVVKERTPTVSTPAIAIKEPSLPGYLDRQQLVTLAQGQLMMSKLDIWAEPLATAIARVTASNLSRLTGSMNIQPAGSFTTLDYNKVLELNITRFEPDASGKLIFEGKWKLQPVTGQETASRFFHIETPISLTPSPMKGRVSAMNQALGSLARQVIPN